MYSIVLMMALSGGAETPAMHGGRHGCCGADVSGCAGHGGCWGGGHACWGGRGGCSGGNGGCWAGGDGCHQRHHRHHGCNGGCNGGCHAYAGCYGGHGGCHAAPAGCHGAAPPPAGAPPARRPAPEKAPPPKPGTEEVSAAAPAIIVVTLPAEAKLSIDDTVTKSTSTTRVFASPSLEFGKEFAYTLKGELVREGRTLTTSQEVKVRAGQETRVNLEFPAERVAQK